jgi:hypothetical protein
MIFALLTPSGARAADIALGWTAPGDDGNVGRAAAYELRYSKTAVTAGDTTSWWNAATVAGTLPPPQTAGATETFTVTGLDSAATYYFVIRTRDEVPNWSGFSNVRVRSTGGGTPTLVPPTGFAAQMVGEDVRLSWNAVSSGNPAGYHVYRRLLPQPTPTLVLTAPVSQTSWTDTSAVAGSTYEYSIRSYSGGTESAPALVSITVPGGPPVPPVPTTELTAYPNPAKSAVTLRFTAGAANGASGRTRLVVYDSTGKRICTLVDAVLPAGETSIQWPCLSDAGNPVAPGLYHAILDTPSGRQVSRLAIVP